MSKFILLVLFAFFTISPVTADSAELQLTPIEQMPAGKYALDLSHASLIWKVNHLGLSHYTARFTKMEATIHLDTKDITKSTLVATVDPLSVETDYPDADKTDFDAKLAKGKDWFNAESFPDIRFVSTRIEQTGEKTANIHGDLTFLGVTKPLVLKTTFNGAYAKKPYGDGAGIGFSATTTLKRSDWGFDTYVPTIGDEVQIMIETEFNQVK